MRQPLPSVSLVLFILAGSADSAELPWQVNTPIATVQKSLYVQHPGVGLAPWVSMWYVGPNLDLLQNTGCYGGLNGSGDELSSRTYRLSIDNGKTWTASKPVVPSSNIVTYGGVNVFEDNGMARLYDPQSGATVELWMRQIENAGIYYPHTYSRLSWDQGVTWGSPTMLRYEAGDEFDPSNPLAPGYLTANQGYFGSSIIKLSNGNILAVLGEANSVDGSHNSSLCMIGTWSASTKDYQWTAGSRTTISPTLSSMGLDEPDVAQLKDGRVLVVWRGLKTATNPGRKFCAISTDGGMTLGPVAELTYDDGLSFYSPCSYHRLIRSSATGKLYWIGNISTTPLGQERYPLIIAEIDETAVIPSLKKNTVTVIDDKQPGQPDAIQFSNFSVLEDRENHALNLYMTPLGEDPNNFLSADNYKYIVTLNIPEPSSRGLLGAGALVLAMVALVRRRRP